MPTPKKLNAAYFLSRLALENGVDPYSINPHKVIEDFFEFDNAQSTIDMFHLACHAGLSETYSWKQGSAGNLVFFYERLEVLVEVCYLVSINRSTKQTIKTTVSKRLRKKLSLPCPLSTNEFDNPQLIFSKFFDLYDLPKWKEILHDWMEAGVSNYSVVEISSWEFLINYCREIERLIYAAYLILVNSKNPDRQS